MANSKTHLECSFCTDISLFQPQGGPFLHSFEKEVDEFNCVNQGVQIPNLIVSHSQHQNTQVFLFVFSLLSLFTQQSIFTDFTWGRVGGGEATKLSWFCGQKYVCDETNQRA